jgi:hypothetical protein
MYKKKEMTGSIDSIKIFLFIREKKPNPKATNSKAVAIGIPSRGICNSCDIEEPFVRRDNEKKTPTRTAGEAKA